MSVSNRGLAIFFSLIAAYALAYFGSHISHVLFRTDEENPAIRFIFTIWVVSVCAGTICGIIGLCVWLFADWNGAEERQKSANASYFKHALMSFIGLSFLFALFARPFDTYGPAPWSWYTSKIAFILVLALIPLVFELKRVVEEAIDHYRRPVLDLEDNIRSFKRRTGT